MTSLEWLTIGFHVVAAVVAMWFAWRHWEHRPVALFLAITAVADAGLCSLRNLVLKPARLSLGPDAPYTGGVRLAFHVSQALYLLWPAAPPPSDPLPH